MARRDAEIQNVYQTETNAAVAIQRVFRGYLGREYAKLKRSLHTRCAMRLQRFWRRYKLRVSHAAS